MSTSSPDEGIRRLAERMREAAGQRRVGASGPHAVGRLTGPSAHLTASRPQGPPVAVATLDDLADRTQAVPGAGTEFDGLFEAVSGRIVWLPGQVQPPESRFMLPVAPVGRPHRPTKRDYDYFDDLNRALAARRSEEQAKHG